MGTSVETQNDMNNELISCIREFLINEARSGSMDFGCVTPLYVYRIWGGTVAYDEIVEALLMVKSRLW